MNLKLRRLEATVSASAVASPFEGYWLVDTRTGGKTRRMRSAVQAIANLVSDLRRATESTPQPDRMIAVIVGDDQRAFRDAPSGLAVAIASARGVRRRVTAIWARRRPPELTNKRDNVEHH